MLYFGFLFFFFFFFSCVGSGLSAAQSDLIANGRPLTVAKRIAILITDGVNNQGPDPVAVATKMKAQGTEIYCIGVGSGVDKGALLALASDPPQAHLFTVAEFSQLASIIGALTFQSCVKVLNINPNHGSPAGGIAAIINGTGFDIFYKGKVYVRFGNTVVQGVYGDDQSLGVVVPAGAAGTSVAVEVSFDGSEFSAGSNVNFTYDSGPGCGPQNCKPNGQCLSGNKCLCNSGWGGPFCNNQICQSPCQNGGQCINGACQCLEGFQGNACQYPLIVCCQYCGVHNPSVNWYAECDKWTSGGPNGSPCVGYSDRTLKKWWVQGSVGQGNCTDPMQCILPGNIWTYPRACISNYGYCNND